MGLKGLWSSWVPDPCLLGFTQMFCCDTQTTLSPSLKELSRLCLVQLCFQVKGRWGHREDTGCGQAVLCLFLTVPWVFWLIWKTCARSGSHWAPLTPFLSPPWHYFLQKWTVPSHQSPCTNRWSTTNYRIQQRCDYKISSCRLSGKIQITWREKNHACFYAVKPQMGLAVYKKARNPSAEKGKCSNK